MESHDNTKKHGINTDVLHRIVDMCHNYELTLLLECIEFTQNHCETLDNSTRKALDELYICLIDLQDVKMNTPF